MGDLAAWKTCMDSRVSSYICREVCMCWVLCQPGVRDECDLCRAPDPPTCPSDTSHYVGECTEECSGQMPTINEADRCINCLQSTVPSQCIYELDSYQTCSGCKPFDCKMCMLTHVTSTEECTAGQPPETLNCMGDYTESVNRGHCKQCVPWFVCIIGMMPECKLCKDE